MKEISSLVMLRNDFKPNAISNSKHFIKTISIAKREG
jgi:hypothetical protein